MLSQANPQESVETLTVVGSQAATQKVSSSTGLALAPEETPQSVTVLDANFLEERDLSSVDDVLDHVI